MIRTAYSGNPDTAGPELLVYSDQAIHDILDLYLRGSWIQVQPY